MVVLFGISQIVYLANPFLNNPSNINTVLIEEEEERDYEEAGDKDFDYTIQYPSVYTILNIAFYNKAYFSFEPGFKTSCLARPETPPPNFC